MTDATATLKNYRQSPRKVRLVADMVRGKDAESALNALSFLPKRAAQPMMQLIKSSVANAQKGSSIPANELIISSIAVNGGIVFKRMMPRARGRGAQILKRTSHITVGLTRKQPKKKAESIGSAQDK